MSNTLLRDLEKAMQLIEAMQNLEIVKQREDSTRTIIALSTILNTIGEVKEELERVQLAQ